MSSLQRGPDGRFSDDDLADILQHATEKPAGAYRARGTPEVLRIIEMLGMQQARSWGVCTFNEFRAFLGLKPMESFEEWNPDPDVAVRESPCRYSKPLLNPPRRTLQGSCTVILTIWSSILGCRLKPSFPWDLVRGFAAVIHSRGPFSQMPLPLFVVRLWMATSPYVSCLITTIITGDRFYTTEYTRKSGRYSSVFP